jgi:fatty acid desaturase
LVANGVLFAGLALAGVWWAYPLLWLLPLMTWMMVITRVRNIAEHAVVGDADDPLRNTRTTRANWIERALVAPYWVNYHLEHHLFFYVPCYNLPKLHRVLADGPQASRMEFAPSYAAVLRKAMARPDNEDRPGERKHGARRVANTDTAASGF